ncbi:type VI secretion system Vgr family protein [Methylobacter sp. BlB1]|uniref:type VI secretion system Vgr family protein n=1 Tax=Methylobacter sp. BlB1 TaxID=2785914 RepID=UPI0018950369|nr:type VI secretion system tip protein VgrG [Methylobacter sp. BlB1]MBF6649056.1 type VI secretion system tip protein VgrG [Methylobacter sp. BlB1]
MAVTQKNRKIQVFTSLGEDTLLFYQMHGREGLSEPFEYRVDLVSEDRAIDPKKILGEPIVIRLQMETGNWRYFHGYVSRFGQGSDLNGLACYHVAVQPWLWFLTRTSNCRIFQNQSVPEIIKQVFQDHGFSDFKVKLSGSYATREYCVQYRETDFNFVSRLMEDEGIYYYFSHEKDKHYLVLADSGNAHDPFPGYDSIPYHIDTGSTDRTRKDHIQAWSFTHEVQPGAYELTDYDFKKPKADLRVKALLMESHARACYELFDYPGRYTETGVGDNFVRQRIEEQHARFERGEGSGNARGLAVGCRFKLKEFPRQDQNREYLVISANYQLKLDEYGSSGAAAGEDKLFDCSFAVQDNKRPYRAPRRTPKPHVQGAQTAFVVGPAGEEIYTDQYGRVKVQFHWDRYGKADENSSCWVRVSQPWAGKSWGMIALPRIGQEVLVDFLEGDPDQPIISGRVYNDGSMPPYKLPDNAHISTIKTNSTKGGDGFNELRFDDKKGEEQVFIHAERNLDVRVKNDSLEWIGNERHLIVKKDLLEQIDGDRHSTIKGDSNAAVVGSLSLKVDQDLQEKVGMKHALDAGQEIHLKAGMNVVIEAGASITLKAGGGFIVVGPSGVTISGTPVLINSGGSAGSGSGCAPDAPKAPKEADQDKAGQVNEAKAASRPPKPTVYGPSAQVLKEAAESGAPFCEKCAEAAAGNKA